MADVEKKSKKPYPLSTKQKAFAQQYVLNGGDKNKAYKDVYGVDNNGTAYTLLLDDRIMEIVEIERRRLERMIPYSRLQAVDDLLKVKDNAMAINENTGEMKSRKDAISAIDKLCSVLAYYPKDVKVNNVDQTNNGVVNEIKVILTREQVQKKIDKFEAFF
jgi:hypothetical protein